MEKIISISKAIGICTGLCTGITGCQSTQHTVHTFNDPAAIHGYQLPVFPDGVEIKASYKQQRNQQVWFWSELENNTYHSGENVIVQIVSNTPVETPPSLFSFSLPQTQGEKTHNAIGPYTRWVSPEANGESCVYARQYTRKEDKWLSVFAQYCTPETKPEHYAWLDALKPSFYLEEL
ncbi:hypothetical protein C942_04427 [Photobacterium marinum]|uniref:Lipoprotein n=1 Tax=Photobacterium marinum TaxID=1056511 RepID=L8JGV9_9GAMM|nr:hypothetical protein [Photobacterium marinum]ELR66729.1 hypothetical protein C942_04427 [Photobacterium marinum]